MQAQRRYPFWSYIFIVISTILTVGCSEQTRVQQKAKPLGPIRETRILAVIDPSETADSDPANSPHQQVEKGVMVIEIAPGGHGVAYVARDSAGLHVTHNGKRGKTYDGIDTTTLRVSRDGTRVAYCAVKGEKWFVVTDDREYGPFDDKGPPVFSPDSRHVAFEAKQGGRWYVFCDGSQSPPLFQTADEPAFSHDSSKIMWLGLNKQGEGTEMVIADLSLRPLATHRFDTLTLVKDPSGRRIVMIDKVGESMIVKTIPFDRPTQVIKEAIYDQIYHPAFTPDGDHFMFIGRRKGDRYVQVDDRFEKLPYGGNPLPPFITPQKTAAVVIEGLNGTYVHHAFSDRTFPPPSKYRECNEVVVSRDGKNHAYVAIRGNTFVLVVNGKEIAGYDRVISPMFAPDGKMLIFRARSDDRRFVVAVDPSTGRVLKEYSRYERVFEPLFIDERTFGYGMKEGNRILWKVESLPALK